MRKLLTSVLFLNCSFLYCLEEDPRIEESDKWTDPLVKLGDKQIDALKRELEAFSSDGR